MQGSFASLSPDLAVKNLKKNEQDIFYNGPLAFFPFKMSCCILNVAIIQGKVDYIILITHYSMNATPQCDSHIWIDFFFFFFLLSMSVFYLNRKHPVTFLLMFLYAALKSPL